MSSLVCRFAPSPNGYLHLGHALSALMNFELARAADGRFLLRIEDIDRARCRPNSRPRSTRIWPGSASPGSARCGARASISTTIGRRSRGWRRWGSSIRASKAGPRSRRWRARRGARRALAARSRRRAALSRRRPGAVARRARASGGGRRAVCAAPRHGGGTGAHRRGLGLDRDRIGSGRRDRNGRGRAGALGRRRAGTQGRARQLSSRGRHRRRAPRRHPCGARARPVLVDQRPPPAAGAPGPAGAGLSSPPSGARRRWPQAVQIDAGDGAAIAAARAGSRPPRSGGWSACNDRSPIEYGPVARFVAFCAGDCARCRPRKQRHPPSGRVEGSALRGGGGRPPPSVRAIEATLAELAHEIRTPLDRHIWRSASC